MYKNVDGYLEKLREELQGCDRALVQDALADAEEHLRTALESDIREKTGVAESELLLPIIEKYGAPEEIASAYREIENWIPPALASSRRQESQSLWGRLFGVIGDPRAWSAFLYMLLGLLFGCFYGLWTLFGAGISAITLILIIGLPVSGLFLLSIKGIALMEGRIVEALLGVRMPRRPLFVKQGLSLKGKFMALVKDSQTWKALVYLFIQFPLGAIYSAATFILFGLSLKFAVYPVWYFALNRPLFNISQPYFPPGWMFPLISVTGFLMIFLMLHLAKSVGKIHGRYAKAMLVRK